MKKYFVANLLIFILLFSQGCQTSPETVEPPAAKRPTATMVSTVSIATLESSPTATEKVMTLEEKVDAFRSGSIEFPVNLSSEQYVAFINEMENQRGPQPIYFEITDGTIWFKADEDFLNKHPELAGEITEHDEDLYHVSGDFLNKYPEIAKEITPRLHLAARIDENSGDLQYLDNETREWVTIPNSAQSWQKDFVVDESNINQAISENWINWPPSTPLGPDKGKYAGMTGIQASLSGINEDVDYAMVHTFLKSTNLETMPIHFKQGGWNRESFLPILIPVKDKNNNLLYFNQALVTSAGTTIFYEEESDLHENYPIKMLNEFALDKTGISEGDSLWITVNKNQAQMWENNEIAVLNDLDGVVPAEESFGVFSGQNSSSELLLVGAYCIISSK